MGKLGDWRRAGALALAVMMGTAPLAAEAAPAVSGKNGKIEASGGTINDEESGFIEGAYSMPWGEEHGLQFDASVGSVDGDLTYGGAVHLFERDPSSGLVGVYASYHNIDAGAFDVAIGRAALEGEYYSGRWTLSGMFGAEFGDISKGVFTIAEVSVYPIDNLRLYLGHHFTQGDEMGKLGAEWQVTSNANTGVAMFLEGRDGANGYDSVFLGLRMYFGDNKTLIRRHREDDPQIRMQEDFFAVDAACGDGSCSGTPAPVVATEEEDEQPTSGGSTVCPTFISTIAYDPCIEFMYGE